MKHKDTIPQTTAQVFAQTLRDIGIRYVFGVPSGPMIEWIQALHDIKGIDFILTSHESGAAFMANVYGRLTGIPGACFSTFGPGATNLSTGVGAAFLDRVPLLAFADEMPDHLKYRTVQMNIDQQALFSPITKTCCRLNPQSAARQLVEAAALARSDIPGPVYIGMPSDIANIHMPQTVIEPVKTEKTSEPIQPELFKKIEALLSAARKPVLVLGMAAAQTQVKSLITKLINQFQIPVVLTPMAKGLVPENHRFYAGVLNHALSDTVAAIHGQSDLVLSVGYDPVEINYEDWVVDVPIIHLHQTPADIDSRALKQVMSVPADLKESINALLDLPAFENDWDTSHVVANKNQMFTRLKGNPGMFGPCKVLDILEDQFPDQGMLVCDVGAHLHLVGQKWKTAEPDRLLITNGWSSMGFAIPAAISAGLSRPEQPVICLTGDGGFLMAAGELATAKRLNLNIIFILLVDHDLSLIRIKQVNKKLTPGYGTKISSADLFDTDSFLGLPVFHSETEQSFADAFNTALQFQGPVIIKSIIDPSEYNRLLLRGNQIR